jgi:hypothetical protein
VPVSFRSGCSGLVMLVAFVLLASPSRAERSRVALLRAAQTDDDVAEVTSRMQAELTASGFAVTVSALATNVEVRSKVVLAAKEPGVVATLAIVSVGKQTVVEVWLPDRITGKITMKRLDPAEVPASLGPAVLAIRAVELVRASLLETIVPLENPAASVLGSDLSVSGFADDRSPARPTERPWPGVSSFEAGLGVLNGFAGLGFSVTPVLRFAYVTPVDLVARVTLSGPSLGPELKTATGSATTRQEFGLVEVAYPLRWGEAATLFGSVGGGVYHLEIQGSAIAPYGSGSPELWSALVDVGAGGALRIGKHTAIVLDVHALATWREALVAFADGETRRSGRPIMLSTLGLWVGL